jgi:hypothetical protein
VAAPGAFVSCRACWVASTPAVCAAGRCARNVKPTVESSSGSTEPTRTLIGSTWVPESQRTMTGPSSVHAATLVAWLL